jgi:hypothetical protein
MPTLNGEQATIASLAAINRYLVVPTECRRGSRVRAAEVDKGHVLASSKDYQGGYGRRGLGRPEGYRDSRDSPRPAGQGKT